MRALSVCLLVSQFLLIVGFSIPLPVAKVIEERFPCESCPCSCRSASQCWDKCCCHTDEEKLAWAEKEGVAPPDFILERVAAKRLASVVQHNPCDSSTAKKCCSCGSKTAKVEPKHRGSRSRVRWVAIDTSLKCCGIELGLVLLNKSYCDLPQVVIDVLPPIVDGWAFPNDQFLTGRHLLVDEPVPKHFDGAL